MIGKIMVIILLAIGLSANNIPIEKDWMMLSEKEKVSILRSFLVGRKYDLGLTMAAINWQESRGGRWQVSTDHSDVGIYHINLYWYFKNLGISDNIYNRSQYTTLLILYPELSEEYVIDKLTTLRKRYNDNFYKVWWRYNGAKAYASKIREKVKFIRDHLRWEELCK